MQTTYEDDLAVLTELVGAGNDLDGAKIALYTAGPALQGNMVLADFTLATFTGAAPVAVVWGVPYQGTDGTPQVDSQLLTFRITGGTVFETIIGYVLTDAAGAVLKAADLFDTPFNLSAIGEGFAFAIAYRRFDGLISHL